MLYETIAFPDNAPLQCSIVEVEEYPFHMHDDVLEIMFALEGSFELTVVNNVLDMKAGDIYVSCPRELHRLCAYPHTRGTVMLLHINVEAYRRSFRTCGPTSLPTVPGEQYRGNPNAGQLSEKAAPQLLDRTGTETAAYREVGRRFSTLSSRSSSAIIWAAAFPSSTTPTRETSSSSGASAGSRTTSTATTTSLSALRMWRPWSTSAPTT